MNRWYLSISLIFLFALSAIGQKSSSDLKKEKEQIQKDIQYKEKLLKQIESDAKTNETKMKLLDKTITQREELINNIREELDLINERIAQNEDLIAALERDIALLKAEYAKMVLQAYKTRNNSETVMYIFASKDIEQAYRRMKYLQQLNEYRQQQAQAIMHAQASLEGKRADLETQREEKNEILNSQNQEKLTLNRQKQEKERKITELRGQEAKYKAELKKAQQKARDLEALIRRAIEMEAKASPKGVALTPEAIELMKNFESNKSKLPWPVDKGEIIGKYGEQPHPFLKGIIVKNNGIVITTTEGTRARAVFSGTVTKILILPGAGKAVMVRHGQYITVYNNLKETFVSAGDEVKTKEEIGVILTDKGKTEVEFQLWKNTDTLDPSYWLYKAR